MVTIVLVAINCVVYLMCQFWGDFFYPVGYLSVDGILYEREYLRFLYSMFLHADLEHLFNNMLILAFLGAMLEEIVGHISYMIVYFISGLGAGALSLLFKVLQGDWSVSLGASGAVFGLDGLLLAMVLVIPHRVRDITPARVGIMIVLSLYSGFAGSNIDNAAHIGGLLIGFLVGVIICTITKRRDAKRRFRIV